MIKIKELFKLLILLVLVSLSKANKCGKGYGTCPDDECCSRYGWCGTTSEYCGYKCQSDYGRCDNISLNTSNLGKNMVEISTSQSGIEGLCKNSKLSKSIIVYYPEWKYYDFPPKNIPFNKLTHINYAFAEIDSNDYSLDYDSSRFLELVETAHEKNKNIKVLMSIGGWTGSKYYSKMASSSSRRSKFVKSVKRMLEASDADGIDIDWEYPGTSGAYDDNFDAENDTNNLLKLLKELREAIGSSKIISAAVPFNTFEVDSRPLKDMSEFAELFDYVNIMAYDFAGSWSTVTSHQSSLYSISEDDNGYSLSGAVSNWINANFPSSKIVVGIPAYGRSWISGSSSNNGYLQRPSNSHPKGDEEDYIDSSSKRYSSTWKYKNIRKAIVKSTYKNSSGDWIRIWDSKSSVPFLFNTNTRQFITYDDPESVSLKADYVINKNLGGMMMWEIEEDTQDSELISTIYEKFISLTCNEANNILLGNKNIVNTGLNINLDGFSQDSSSYSSYSSSSKSSTTKSTTTRTTKKSTTKTTKKSTKKSSTKKSSKKKSSTKTKTKTTTTKRRTTTTTTTTTTNSISTYTSYNSGGGGGGSSCPNASKYKCCDSCKVSVDDGNKWGILNGEWCSITYDCLEKINQCWAEAYGYSCCTKCVSVVDISNNRKWGIENNRWCGIPSYF
jgi:chitinase